MKILLLEPFYGSSHKQWADGLMQHSNHDIHLISLPGRHWKWRMHHASRYFANEIHKLDQKHDVILCTDLMNLAEFRGLLSAFVSSSDWFNKIPIGIYFHENQITYPWSETDPDVDLKRDNHYGWINYISGLASDFLLFNSEFHKQAFLSALPSFLDQFPKSQENHGIEELKLRSAVIPIGLDLATIQSRSRVKNKVPTILWNHRWEFDKNPELFFSLLFQFQEEGLDFNVIVAGESYSKYPTIFNRAKKLLAEKIIHFGFAKDKSAYHDLLGKSDIMPVTSNQDFFGISAVEGIAAGCLPLLPRRLAFPEHLRGEEFDAYYYDSDSDLLIKLRHAISSFNFNSEHCRSHILKYDWNQIIIQYDAFFEQL